jgi:conjugal transfer pilus assembly protein TraW
MIKSCAFILLILFGTIALAKDYGVSGHTFEIKEEGFLSMIYRKLGKIDLSEENKKMQQLAIKKVEQPTAVEGIKKAEKDQSFTFDPTYEVTEDIILPSVQVLYPLGTKVNPVRACEVR